MTEPAAPAQPARSRRAALIGAAGLPLLLPPRRAAASIDHILVEKSQRSMTLLAGGEAVQTFKVALGRGYGPKLRQGDGRTPEGFYHVDRFNERSAFYRSIGISYPNEDDLQRAAAAGVRPGGNIMIHGLDPGIARRWRDEHWKFSWTNGCIAVTDAEMDEVWERVALGTPVEIRP